VTKDSPQTVKSIRTIGDLIPAILEKLGLARGVKEHEILERWAEIVGPRIAEVSSAERIRDGKLWVVVRHPAWRNELNFMKRELVEKINRELGETIVKDIIFR
jgi:predicted nucleic acid-binding Zn ribbon protein